MRPYRWLRIVRDVLLALAILVAAALIIIWLYGSALSYIMRFWVMVHWNGPAAIYAFW